MKRYSPLLLMTLMIAAFAVPTLAQAVPSAAPSLANKPKAPPIALRDSAAEEEGEFELEAGEIEECEAAESIFEAEEEEFEDEAEEEEFEIEVEECEEEILQKKGAVTAPAECLVRSAESSITTLPSSDRVELTVRYLTYKPSTVSLGLKLKDGQGSLNIENTVKHLGKQGVLHLTTKVSDAVMDRATKANEFDVALRAPKTPGYCGTMLEQKLKAKHPVGNARVYTQLLND
jgi:hypothetical protein